MMKALLEQHGISVKDLAAQAQISRSAMSRLVNHGEWPRRQEQATLRSKLHRFLQESGVSERELVAELPVDDAQKNTGVVTAITTPAHPNGNPNVLEELMLLRNEALSPATLRHFKMAGNPFVDDVNSPDDVFLGREYRYTFNRMLDVATHGGFIAVVGESGSGKSTLRELLEERSKEDGRFILVQPYVLAMEDNDAKGKTLKSASIAESIIRTLVPHESPKRSADARFRQVHELLKKSAQSGVKHVLVIEEAHCLPIPTLKHLKRFRELKDGMRPLLGVILIGQPELKHRLSEQNPEVREVVQRCELGELYPLDGELEQYLKHKFKRVDVDLNSVLEPDVFDAIRTRLIYRPRGSNAQESRSICYPLVVNNLICRAMNYAAKIAAPKVNGEVISEAAK